jgi:hypothetical protein
MSIEPDTAEIATMTQTPPVEILAIPVPLAQRVVDYLAGRPYVEVFELIQDLQSLSPP